MTDVSNVSKKNKRSTSSNTRDRSRCFSLTLNNYTKEEYNNLQELFLSLKCNYIIGKEIGEKGTPHLQMYIKHKNQISFSTLKKFNERLHIEESRLGAEYNFNYCAKDLDYITNMEKDKKRFEATIGLQKRMLITYSKIIWKPWQKQIIDICKTEPENRKINFVIDEQGNSGKSFLCKYLFLSNEGVIIAEGKKNDILNQIKMSIDNGILPKIVLLDVPRNQVFKHYTVIEQMKNGLLYSGKYEGGVCCFNPPHVFVFTNNEIDETVLTKDRYNFINIDG